MKRPCLAFSACFFFLVCSGMGAQAPHNGSDARNLEKQLLEDKAFAPYRAAFGEIAEVFAPALDAGVPSGLALDRIREAASKRIALDRALAAFRVDSDNLAFLAALALDKGWPGEDRIASFLSEAAAALRNGLGRPAVETVFSLANFRDIDPGRAAAAMTAVSAARRALPCDDEDAALLCGAIAASELPSDKISMLASFAALARKGGMGAADFYEFCSDEMKGGASMTQLERALRGRLR